MIGDQTIKGVSEENGQALAKTPRPKSKGASSNASTIVKRKRSPSIIDLASDDEAELINRDHDEIVVRMGVGDNERGGLGANMEAWGSGMMATQLVVNPPEIEQ